LVALLIIAPGFLAFITVWFVNPATAAISTVGSSNAVVVFAGSRDRLETAVELMESGAAPNLVIPNGVEVAPALCNGTPPFLVYCPETEGVNTEGEARAIGHVATENGWARLTAVTSIYHVRRATSLLGQCFDGEIVAVTPNDRLDAEDWVNLLPHEWAGFMAGVILHPGC
jgi:uncharacterized SAM-binding protein YcdF (DUF218 family)